MYIDHTKLVYLLQDFCRDIGVGLDMAAPSHVAAVDAFKHNLKRMLERQQDESRRTKS